MGYRFSGIFTQNLNNGFIESTLEKWPFCGGGEIFHPFYGIVIQYPDYEDMGILSDEKLNLVIEQIGSIHDNILEWE